jgi:hypothetical protein
MIYKDDYDAKFRIWARDPKVVACPKPVNLPRFKARRFNSYEEFNAWKEDLMEQVARQGGIQWTK